MSVHTVSHRCLEEKPCSGPTPAQHRPPYPLSLFTTGTSDGILRFLEVVTVFPLAAMPIDDDQLAARAARGDQAAWAQLVSMFQRRVTVSLLALGLGVDDAREVSQDAWARVWQQHQTGALNSLSFPGIVITQAHYLARDLLRRRRINPQVSDDGSIDPAASGPTAEATLASAQALARVRMALESLPPAKQRVFRLATDEGVPHAVIADRVGLSIQRVKQIVWEVRTILRAALEETA